MDKRREKAGVEGLLGGTLNILGLTIDLGELVEEPEKLRGRLEELREKLKAAGGREALSEGEWRKGGVRVSGHIRVRGLQGEGEREFHVGTFGGERRGGDRGPTPRPAETVEPPVDVFDEGQQVTIVADVPGVTLEDMQIKAAGRLVSLATKATARRGYQKEVRLDADLEPESLQASCHNGVLEIRVKKQAGGPRRGRRSGVAPS